MYVNTFLCWMYTNYDWCRRDERTPKPVWPFFHRLDDNLKPMDCDWILHSGTQWVTGLETLAINSSIPRFFVLDGLAFAVFCRCTFSAQFGVGEFRSISPYTGVTGVGRRCYALLDKMPWIVVALKSLGNLSYFRFFRFLCRAQFSCSGCKTFDQPLFHC